MLGSTWEGLLGKIGERKASGKSSEMRWMSGATELSLLKDQCDLGRDFVGKREHELRGR